MGEKSHLREYIRNSVYEKYICQFLVVAASICLFFVIYRFDIIWVWVKKCFAVLQPINIGLILAYLVNPVVRYWERKFERLFTWINRKKKWIKNVHGLSRGLSVGMSLALVVALIVGLVLIVVPELLNSVLGLIRDMPAKFDSFNLWFQKEITKHDIDNATITAAVYDMTNYIENWFTTDFAGVVNAAAGRLTSGIVSFLGIFFDCIIGLIVSAYILCGKERFTRMFKKIIFAAFGEGRAGRIMESLRTSDKVFGGFISGKLIDSLIIGLLCFIALSIMNMPYTLLVSVAVGTTNVIPFFGPYIGGVPSAILILIDNPIKGIYFIIFIIILQQFDGNILGPRILGESTGLTAFWVVFAILVFGGLFGLFGWLVGVPTFAVIYGFVKKSVEEALKKKGIQIE